MPEGVPQKPKDENKADSLAGLGALLEAEGADIEPVSEKESFDVPEDVNEEPVVQEIIITPKGQNEVVLNVEEYRGKLEVLLDNKIGDQAEIERILKPIKKLNKEFNRELERLVSIPSSDRRADSVQAFRVSRMYLRIMNQMNARIEALESGEVPLKKITKTVPSVEIEDLQPVFDGADLGTENKSEEQKFDKGPNGPNALKETAKIVDEMYDNSFTDPNRDTDEESAREEGYVPWHIRHKNGHVETRWKKEEVSSVGDVNSSEIEEGPVEELSPEEISIKVKEVIQTFVESDDITRAQNLYEGKEDALYGSEVKGEEKLKKSVTDNIKHVLTLLLRHYSNRDDTRIKNANKIFEEFIALHLNAVYRQTSIWVDFQKKSEQEKLTADEKTRQAYVSGLLDKSKEDLMTGVKKAMEKAVTLVNPNKKAGKGSDRVSKKVRTKTLSGEGKDGVKVEQPVDFSAYL